MYLGHNSRVEHTGGLNDTGWRAPQEEGVGAVPPAGGAEEEDDEDAYWEEKEATFMAGADHY